MACVLQFSCKAVVDVGNLFTDSIWFLINLDGPPREQVDVAGNFIIHLVIAFKSEEELVYITVVIAFDEGVRILIFALSFDLRRRRIWDVLGDCYQPPSLCVFRIIFSVLFAATRHRLPKIKETTTTKTDTTPNKMIVWFFRVKCLSVSQPLVDELSPRPENW